MSKLKSMTVIISMLLVGSLEFYALHLGHNGIMLTTTIAVIAGLGGYSVKSINEAKKESKKDADNTK